jgi:hypothetical protein
VKTVSSVTGNRRIYTAGNSPQSPEIAPDFTGQSTDPPKNRTTSRGCQPRRVGSLLRRVLLCRRQPTGRIGSHDSPETHQKNRVFWLRWSHLLRPRVTQGGSVWVSPEIGSGPSGPLTPPEARPPVGSPRGFLGYTGSLSLDDLHESLPPNLSSLCFGQTRRKEELRKGKGEVRVTGYLRVRRVTARTAGITPGIVTGDDPWRTGSGSRRRAGFCSGSPGFPGFPSASDPPPDSQLSLPFSISASLSLISALCLLALTRSLTLCFSPCDRVRGTKKGRKIEEKRRNKTRRDE